MIRFLWLSVFVSTGLALRSQTLRLIEIGRDGNVSWAGAIVPGICTIETTSALNGPWQPSLNVFSTNSAGRAFVSPVANTAFYRLRNVEVGATPEGFQNLARAYGVLETIAGSGLGAEDGTNYWQTDFEGQPATQVALSRPHFAQADRFGNVFIVDKDSHSILKVTPDGLLQTVAGTHQPGFNGDGALLGTMLQLNSPNGLCVRDDGAVYILDTGNGRVRRLDTNGIMRTLFRVPGGIDGGRGLWVSDDESVAYFASETSIKKWTPDDGVETFSDGFLDLGNIIMGADARLVVTDRGANSVYRLSRNAGNRTLIAGNGKESGGGDGFLAVETGLHGVRGIWFLPTGGYLLATHEGSHVWYVDTAGIIHLFVDGARHFHFGDGEWFYNPGPKVSECRSVAVDPAGNILIVENDAGYVRRIRFLPFTTN
jgi:sugar lactone lactonase YvrE